MTREQSKNIQEVERIIDYLCYKVNTMTAHDGCSTITDYIHGSLSPNDDYRKDVAVLNAKLHDYELGLLNELKDKWLKIYAEL